MPTYEETRERLKAGKNVPVRPMADAIGIHPNTLWKAIREGQVRAVRVGRAVSIPSAEGLRLLGIDGQTAA